MNRRSMALMVMSAAALLMAGCGVLRDAPPTVTPIVITATPELPVIPIIATETPTLTAVVAATNAALLPTHIPTDQITPTFTPRPPSSLTPTFTPTTTDTPVTPGVMGFAPVGGVPGSVSAADGSTCGSLPSGTLGAIYQSDPTIAAGIGCALAAAPLAVGDAYQPFQNGVMIWVASVGTGATPAIYALYNNGTYQRFNDTWQEGVDPASGGMAPPPGLVEPVRGFGKVWRDNASARDGLGWALTGESGGTAQVLAFERGEMLSVPQAGQTYIMIAGAPGTWTARSGG